jgi:hypothetical protein
MRHTLRRNGWPRFWLTTYLLALALTGVAQSKAGHHPRPLVDWLWFGVFIALIRLTCRGAWRVMRRRQRDASL